MSTEIQYLALADAMGYAPCPQEQSPVEFAEALRKDAERYRKLREAGSALKLYVYEDQADPCSGDWQYKPSPEDVDAFADGLGAA